jgi:hypothetical protein
MNNFKPGDRVVVCPVVESVDGDFVNIVTWDGLHVRVPSVFLQHAPEPDVRYSLATRMLTAEGMAALINHGKVPA